jgi:hypothetical protein
MNFLNSSWGNVFWTPWFPFTDAKLFRDLPSGPGMYRIRASNGQELFYVGETGRDLRGRLGDLRRNTIKVVMPFNDPHTAAPSLWAWRDAENIEFECAVAPVQLADEKEEARRLREGLEFYLLWLYRLEFGASTRCNHGRFHPRYVKSADRKKGFVGHRLPDDAPDNPAGGPSLLPLKLIGEPLEQHWMGLTWNDLFLLIGPSLKQIPTKPGVYKIIDPRTYKLLYIGETSNLRNRFDSHVRKPWTGTAPLVSYALLPLGTPAYQRHEIENDLVAGYYAQTRSIPHFQLANHR